MNAPTGELPRRERLAWGCRRGMKELDLLLQRWLQQHYAQAGAPERAAFAELLELPDPELARYLLAGEMPETAALRSLVTIITANQG